MCSQLVTFLKNHKEEIAKSQFIPVLREAYREDVLEEVIEHIEQAGIAISPTDVFNALFGGYHSSDKNLVKARILINKYQLLVLKALFK